jgi:hypothetical protein
MDAMKTILFAAMLAAGLLAVGCVNTVNDRSTAGMPFTKDRVEGRYPRTLDQVFQAAKDVIKKNGVMVNEGILYGQTNTVKTIEAKVNQRSVYIRVEPVDPKITSIVVQARTSGGGSDIDTAHELEKQVALQLK